MLQLELNKLTEETNRNEIAHIEVEKLHRRNFVHTSVYQEDVLD